MIEFYMVRAIEPITINGNDYQKVVVGTTDFYYTGEFIVKDRIAVELQRRLGDVRAMPINGYDMIIKLDQACRWASDRQVINKEVTYWHRCKEILQQQEIDKLMARFQ